ncbi:uncharacterized protein RJT21DRAFT_123190 [Scheffersomyces amazonensis]|uniref:uncharacterized protein n=1 Tax=Scheffersomyces amazonensis TaxID=1078765 RepID=UPI00315D0F14
MWWKSTLTILFLVSVYTSYLLGTVSVKDETITSHNSRISNRKVSSYPHNETIVIFPKDFAQINRRFGYEDDYAFFNNQNLSEYYSEKFSNSASSSHLHIIQHNDEEYITHAEYFTSDFKDYNIDIFDANLLDNEETTCDSGFKNQTIQIGGHLQVDSDLLGAVQALRKFMESNPGFKDLDNYIFEDIDALIKFNLLDKYFFKFVGTSVWLEQFGVHYMVSRVSYTHSTEKSKPNLSLFYAQIFDENWQELKDVELIMPITIDNIPKFKNIHFPSYIPIPFHRRTHTAASYGIEDPRLLLMKNNFGFDEPMIVYNAYHRDILSMEEASKGYDQRVSLNLGIIRSIFFAFPFQFELGIPPVIDGFYNPTYDRELFSKVIILDRTGRQGIQKNWTPFINPNERVNGVDTHIYLIYRWAKLEIIKCELSSYSSKGKSSCKVVYKKDKKLDPNADVGDFRGGTEMIHVNQYLPHLKQDTWVGFPRVSIKGCGCGLRFYRPNLAILTKNEEGFDLPYISSLITFDIPITSFNGKDNVCDERFPNVLLPNGISSWVTSSDSSEDFLTISLSVSDSTNHLLTIKNFLPLIDELIANQGSNSITDKVLDCALQESRKFCSIYGAQNLNQQDI